MAPNRRISLSGFIRTCEETPELRDLWKRFINNSELVIRERLRVVFDHYEAMSSVLVMLQLIEAEGQLRVMCKATGVAVPNLALNALAVYAIRKGA